MISIIISLSKKNCSRNSGFHGELCVFYYFDIGYYHLDLKRIFSAQIIVRLKKNFSKVSQTKCRRGGHMAGNKVWHTNTKKDKVIKDRDRCGQQYS